MVLKNHGRGGAQWRTKTTAERAGDGARKPRWSSGAGARQ